MAQFCGSGHWVRPTCSIGNPQGLVGWHLIFPSTLFPLCFPSLWQPLYLLPLPCLILSFSDIHQPNFYLTLSRGRAHPVPGLGSGRPLTYPETPYLPSLTRGSDKQPPRTARAVGQQSILLKVPGGGQRSSPLEASPVVVARPGLPGMPGLPGPPGKSPG